MGRRRHGFLVKRLLAAFFLLERSLPDVLSYLTTTSPIDTSDIFPAQVFAESQNFVFFSPQHLKSRYWRNFGKCWFSIKILSSRCLLIWILGYHQFQDIQTKNCSDLSSDVIEKRNTHKTVTDVTKFSRKKNCLQHFHWSKLFQVFWVFWQLLVSIETLNNFLEQHSDKTQKFRTFLPKARGKLLVKPQKQLLTSKPKTNPAGLFWF